MKSRLQSLQAQGLCVLEASDFDGCGKGSLPEEIGELTGLTSIRLTSFHLVELPASISRLHLLQTLCFDSNQLTSLPASISALSVLRSLSLQYNRLGHAGDNCLTILYACPPIPFCISLFSNGMHTVAYSSPTGGHLRRSLPCTSPATNCVPCRPKFQSLRCCKRWR